MKRFLLFAGLKNDPGMVGWHGYRGQYDDLGTAVETARRRLATDLEWAHVVDTRTLLVTWEEVRP